jgi:hypothetical protein
VTDKSGRRATVVVALLLFAVFARVLVSVAEAPAHVFAETRLMPLVATAAGAPAYPEPGAEPFYLPMYPPLAYLPYLPTLLPREPLGALRTGALIAELCTLLPVWLLLAAAAPGRERRQTRLLAFGLTAAWIHLSPVLTTLLYIHADAPAVLVSGIGVWFLVRASETRSHLLLIAAVGILSLAPWAKQTFFPLVALPAVALFRESRRKALFAVAAGALLAALWLGLFSVLFGFRGVVFWLFQFAARHPLIASPAEALDFAHRVLLAEGFWALALVLMLLLARRGVAGDPTDRARGRSVGPARILLAASVLLWPTSVLGFVKEGGALNAFIPTLFFLTLAAVSLLLGDGAPEDEASAAPLLGRLGLPFALVLGVPLLLDVVARVPTLVNGTWESSFVFETTRRNPGRLSAPWFPLSTWFATGALTPSELGIRERRLAGLDVPPGGLTGLKRGGPRAILCGKDPCPDALRGLAIGRTTEVRESGRTWQIYEVARGE